MAKSVTSIPGIGPATKAQFDRAGIPDAETLRAMGADQAYVRLIETGTRPHFIGFYALHMALQGRPWNDCKGQEKEDLRVKYDALMSGAAQTGAGPSPDLRRFLADIGLG